MQLHGAVYGKGIYLSPSSAVSLGYTGCASMPPVSLRFNPYPLNSTHTHTQSSSTTTCLAGKVQLICLALCEGKPLASCARVIITTSLPYLGCSCGFSSSHKEWWHMAVCKPRPCLHAVLHCVRCSRHQNYNLWYQTSPVQVWNRACYWCKQLERITYVSFVLFVFC